jgi:DNA-binding CsgD family transcriptional regulator/tetratricopeptide (TPR) repeat protein
VEFDVDALAHIAEQPARAVLEALQLAALAGLVRETAPRRFAFTHPIVRLALRAELAPSFARPYHRRAAQLWERDAASVAACEAVAEHWRDADEAEQARAWDERAGDAAVEGEDFARAAAAYRRAESDRPDEATRRRLLLKAANALRRAGLEHEALLAFDDYFACGPVAEDGRPAQALLEKMQLSWGAGDVAAVDALAEEILGLDLPQIDPIKAHTLVRLAGMRWVAGRHAEAQECIDRVEREYPLVDPEILGEFHQQRGLLAYGTGRFDDAIEELRRGLRYIERSGNAALHAQQLCNFGNVALVHARNDLALELLERAVALTGVIASESKRAFVYASYARALMQVGRLREAREALRALESADADIAELHVPYTVVPMLELGSMLDDDALIERALEGDPLEQAFASGEPQRILPLATAFAAYQWYRGGRETARELLHRALVANGSGSWHYGFALLVAKIGSLRDVPRARRMLEPARATGEPAVIAAFGDLFDAFVERRRGRNAAAVTCGRRAARAFAGFGWPCFEAQAHQAAGDPAAALRTYERIGDVRDAKELRAAPRPARRAPGHVALTAREREVGLLAVDGLSNPEIAGRLGIGVRTVEHHLQALYGKLGIRSRWQLPSEF